MERLTKVIRCEDGTAIYDISNKLLGLDVDRATKTRMILEKLATYEDAEEHGKPPWLPCKAGNIENVYIHQFDNEFKKVVVEAKVIDITDTSYITKLKDGRKLSLPHQFVGKTVFLTRKAAEAKLKEMEE